MGPGPKGPRPIGPKGSLAKSIVKAVREATPDLTNFHSRHRMLVFPPGTDIESATDRAQGLLEAGFQGLQEALAPR